MSTLQPTNDALSPPDSDEIEVAVIGTGFGESIVIHAGNGDWLVVDSCISSTNQVPLPLKYLESLGVPPQAVKVIVATHWDDDHIRGFGRLVDQCDEAEICISAVLTDSKFSKIAFDSPLSRLAQQNPKTRTGISEFNYAIKTAKARNQSLRRLQRDTRVWKSPATGSELISLSPHETIYEKALDEIIKLIPTGNEVVGKIRAPACNDTSVVLAVSTPSGQILLGADLEETSAHKGWSLIVSDSSYASDLKGAVFKVPHHGSKNGHHEKVWSHLLEKNPVCVIAPFNRNPGLPGESDVTRIWGYTDNLHLCSEKSGVGLAKSKDKHLRRVYLSRNAKPLAGNMGVVRLRRKPSATEWSVQHLGPAVKLIEAA